MDKYLPTGNDFVSLPRINERTGGIEDITFLYMAAKGLIDIRGSESTPLIQPYVHLDGVGFLSPAHLAWTRLDDWLPQSTAQLGSLELKTLYIPPIDERGFAIQMTVHNTSESAKDVVIGLNGCWASSWHCVNEDKPLSGKATCFRSGWNSSLIFEYHAGFPMFAFFCMFFSTGITLDTEELVLVTSRSPRYYVSAAYWDRDSLLWSFPAILDADSERAKEMLSYVFGRQRRNFGIHSRYIDGTVLEPGFELDELVAPLLALERYINKTDDKSILNDPDIVQGISLILNRLRQHEAASCRLYDTFLQPTDDEHVYPYITYDNVLVWKALKDLAQLAPQYAHLEKTASEIKDAIMTHCVQKDAEGKPYFGWSIDLNGSHDVYDEPPGSLQLLPLFDFCSPTDEIYRNTVAMIRSPEYKYSFANSPINEIGCPHAPHPWILSLANSLLCGRVEHCRAILEKISMDNGIACESVDEVTGYCTTGEAFATCAGFLCHSIREALL